MFQYGRMQKGGVPMFVDKKLPVLLSAEASYQLWLEMRAGAGVDEHMHKLTEGNMRIAAAIASRYGVMVPWLRQDLYAEALLGLVDGVSRLLNCSFKDPGGLRGYLRKTIHGFVGQLISSQIGLGVSTTQVTRVKRGKDKRFKTLNELVKVQSYSSEEVTLTPREVTAEEGREHLIDRMQRLMKDAGLDEHEYQVMLFYLAGYSNEETAVALGISTGKVQYKKVEAAEKIKYIFFDDIVDMPNYKGYSDSITTK